MAINRDASALDIYIKYKTGYKDKEFAKGTLQSKKFFLGIRTAVIAELEKTGFCELVDTILGNNQIDVVVYSAIVDIAKGYEEHSLTDIKNDSNYVPHISSVSKGEPISWFKCAHIGEQRLERQHVEIIHKAQKVVRTKHLEYVNKSKCVDNTTNVLQDAQDKANQIEEEARREAGRIIDEAKLEATRINENAHIDASTIIDGAKESADKLIERYLVSEQKRFKGELNEELSRHTAELLDSSKRADITHIEMCNATNALQIKWVNTLENALSQMADVKAEFYAHIHDWQVSLFPSEIKPLAERYQELYRIINVDKLLREALLFKNKTCDDSIRIESSDGTEIVAASSEECPATVIEGLQKLNNNLTILLRKFELALNGLDLYVFYPKVGDKFDDMWHVPYDEMDEKKESSEKRVKECVTPGIAKKAKDDYGDDVVIPAEVIVEMEN